MALFSKNKYASHPDLLDIVAKKSAEIALSQIKRDITKTKKPCTYCKFGYGGLEFNDEPLAIDGNCRVDYCMLYFRDLNMEIVPCDDETLFFSALLPHLQKHLNAALKQYFPTATGVSAAKATYVYYKNTANAIEIEVKGVSNPSPKPTLSKW